jgi:hypothetical protein
MVYHLDTGMLGHMACGAKHLPVLRAGFLLGFRVEPYEVDSVLLFLLVNFTFLDAVFQFLVRPAQEELSSQYQQKFISIF